MVLPLLRRHGSKISKNYTTENIVKNCPLSLRIHTDNPNRTGPTYCKRTEIIVTRWTHALHIIPYHIYIYEYWSYPSVENVLKRAPSEPYEPKSKIVFHSHFGMSASGQCCPTCAPMYMYKQHYQLFHKHFMRFRPSHQPPTVPTHIRHISHISIHTLRIFK